MKFSWMINYELIKITEIKNIKSDTKFSKFTFRHLNVPFVKLVKTFRGFARNFLFAY